LELIDVQQPPFNDTTRVRFSRPLATGDFKQDVDILQVVDCPKSPHLHIKIVVFM
jgi:hypothetical protein